MWKVLDNSKWHWLLTTTTTTTTKEQKVILLIIFDSSEPLIQQLLQNHWKRVNLIHERITGCTFILYSRQENSMWTVVCLNSQSLNSRKNVCKQPTVSSEILKCASKGHFTTMWDHGREFENDNEATQLMLVCHDTWRM